MTMQILHGDMKSYNILVNGDFVICKLCDFGVCLPLDENGVFDKRMAGKATYFGKILIHSLEDRKLFIYIFS